MFNIDLCKLSADTHRNLSTIRLNLQSYGLSDSFAWAFAFPDIISHITFLTWKVFIYGSICFRTPAFTRNVSITAARSPHCKAVSNGFRHLIILSAIGYPFLQMCFFKSLSKGPHTCETASKN